MRIGLKSSIHQKFDFGVELPTAATCHLHDLT